MHSLLIFHTYDTDHTRPHGNESVKSLISLEFLSHINPLQKQPSADPSAKTEAAARPRIPVPARRDSPDRSASWTSTNANSTNRATRRATTRKDPTTAPVGTDSCSRRIVTAVGKLVRDYR